MHAFVACLALYSKVMDSNKLKLMKLVPILRVMLTKRGKINIQT